MLTTTEAAAALNITRRRVQELIRLGTLKAEKFGRDWQIDAASVEAYRVSDRKPGRPNVATNVAEKAEPQSSKIPTAS